MPGSPRLPRVVGQREPLLERVLLEAQRPPPRPEVVGQAILLGAGSGIRRTTRMAGPRRGLGLGPSGPATRDTTLSVVAKKND